MMTKWDFILMLRRYQHIETLDLMVIRKRKKVKIEELEFLYSAADHRLAEIMMKRYYTRVPSSIWTSVR